ncbi:coiled-coil domain-containing protein 167 isoform X2 [Pogona vitticeps]|uniref:Coiled-coil domain-containing protein 167 n=1 Tax=Pogona vitticeps TaxID=103695 RepID=A0A6J0T068_9SAUR|nr:coiled-coil domain-containing protein 167 [Pogona vitticeps]
MSEKRQDSLSVAQQVDHLEDKLLHCREALEDIDFKLRREDLTLKRRESLEKQKSLLAMQAEAYEKELKILHQENRKIVALSAAVVLLVVVIYTCWTM